MTDALTSAYASPEERDAEADVSLASLEGMPPATVAILEEGGYETLNDIIDLEREDYLRLPGITPGEADRLMAIVDELTTDDGGEGEGTDAPKAKS